MALIFTDNQIKSLTKDTLDLPLIIDNPSEGTGLIQQQAAIQVAKDEIYIVDQQNKVFSNHWIDVISKYHTELERLNKTVKSLYSEVILDDGARGLPDHYTPTWPNLVPIVVDQNNGSPTSVSGVQSETERIATLESSIDKLINGFTGTGSVDDVLDDPYTIGDGFLSTSATLTSGDLVIVDSGGSSMLVLIGAAGGFCTPTATPDTEAQCTIEGGAWTSTTSIIILSTDKNFGAGARIRNFHSGFTNSERGHQGAPNYAFDVMVYFEGEITTNTTGWKINLNDQKTSLENNDDIAPRNASNILELAELNVVIPDITIWEGIVIVDPNGKFTDASLVLYISDNVVTRNFTVPLRIGEININLGSVVQAGDGSVVESGVYGDLWKFVLIRISKSGGSLTGYYGMDLGIIHFDTKIANANSQLEQYENTFAITLIIEDTIVGQISFEVESVVDFSIGQTVKVMDNESVVYTRIINNILGSDIILDSGIPSILTTGNQARIVRQK